MKQGTVKVSEEFIKPDGTKKWYTHEKQYNQDTEDPVDVFAKAEAEMNAYIKNNSQVAINGTIPPGPSTELPVINKAEERLGILIENASTKEELMGYKNDCSTVYLADLWATKLSTLNK